MSRGDWTSRLHLRQGGRAYEIEDLLSLVLTTGWRRAGWVPLHGGGLVRDGRGLLCVATSGGGKTTFTVSLIRRGWRALGDDKVLLATAAGAPRVVGCSTSSTSTRGRATGSPRSAT